MKEGLLSQEDEEACLGYSQDEWNDREVLFLSLKPTFFCNVFVNAIFAIIYCLSICVSVICFLILIRREKDEIF